MSTYIFLNPYKVLPREECKYPNRTRALFSNFRSPDLYQDTEHNENQVPSITVTWCNLIFVVFRILIKVRRPKIWKKEFESHLSIYFYFHNYFRSASLFLCNVPYINWIMFTWEVSSLFSVLNQCCSQQ